MGDVPAERDENEVVDDLRALFAQENPVETWLRTEAAFFIR